MVRIVRVEGADGEHRALFDAWAEVYVTAARHIFGDGHSAWTAEQLRQLWSGTDRERHAWVALTGNGADEAVVASGGLVLPLHDNPRYAAVTLAVHPDHRRRASARACSGWSRRPPLPTAAVCS